MSIVWLLGGALIAVILLILQWAQVRRVSPGYTASRWRIFSSFFGRMLLFAVAQSFALLHKPINGLIFFSGFWVTRSLALIILGSTQKKRLSGSNT